tara:strand:+ start:692 stop:1453 length:762 start_codon:yes stop_codon:yes gene_type:complete
MFSYFCFSEIGFDLLKISIDSGYLPKQVFTCINDKIIVRDKIKKLCESQFIEYIETDRKININKYFERLDKSLKKPSLIILLWWPYILKEDFISNIDRIVNLHPSYLPYGRGKYGYVWAIEKNQKYGATIHLVDKDIDSGMIICQEDIEVNIEDTGETLRNKSILLCKLLFKKNLNNIIRNKIKPYKLKIKGDYNSKKHFIDSNNDLAKKYTIREAIDFLRARTFKNGQSYIIRDDKNEYECSIDIKKINKDC